MPSWTLDQYQSYVNRNRIQNTQPERAAEPGPLGTQGRAQESPPGVVVRITSYRNQLLDADNLAGGSKYLIDGLRYAGLIPGDSPDQIELQVRQVKVKKSEERTEIELQPRKSEVE